MENKGNSVQKGGFISGCIRYKHIVWMVLTAIVLFGIYGLFKMKKDEFPAFTIRQGVVVGVYPGASPEEVEEQLTRPLEHLLFSIPEINREATYSVSKEGFCYVFVNLNFSVKDKDAVWSKVRNKLNESKAMSFPMGVLALVVIDDFGNTSSLLIAMESEDKTYREMHGYTDDLTERLRSIPGMGNVKVLGERKEEIAVKIDQERLAFYGINPKTLLLNYTAQNFLTTSGTLGMANFDVPLHIESSITSEKELENHIVYSDPDGNMVRLRDIATVERRYAKPTNLVNFNGRKALIVSVEMCKGYDIVAFGEKIEQVLQDFQETLPDSVSLYRITDQPKVVKKSVSSFLRDLVIAMIVVIAVMLMLFPIRTALIASSGLPICTAVSVAVMYLLGIELNTVTLAALIVVLGMIVDDSIINIDGYVERLRMGYEPFDAAVSSAKELFMPMFIATSAICTMFFPIKFIIKGYLGDFVQLFPWTVAFSLMSSLAYALLVIPALEIRFIRLETDAQKPWKIEQIQQKFFVGLQNTYDRLQAICFKRPFITIGVGVASVVVGILMFLAMKVQMMPTAERDSFAVEVRLPEGCSLEQTSMISDSLQKLMLQDNRVVSVTSFIGESAPRFHVTYAPGVPSKNVSQLIVNTTSSQTTEELLKEWDEKYAYYFPGAIVRLRQLDYQPVSYPIEIFVYGSDYAKMGSVSEKIKDYMLTLDDELRGVHTDYDEYMPAVKVTMNPEECARLGITKGTLSLDLAGSLNGQPLTSIWEENRRIPVNLYANEPFENMDFDAVKNQLVPSFISGSWVPLRQVATVSPEWQPAQIVHRNGKNVITVCADMKFWKPQTVSMKKIQDFIDAEIMPSLPEGVSIEYGGLTALNENVIPEVLVSVIVAVLVLFSFLVAYFKKVNLAVLTIGSSSLCLFGAFFGEWLFGLDFGMTSVLGIVSLIGIIVRNGIIMYEYAETLRVDEGYSAKEAAKLAGSRRMRPIFLTSATTALGVLPMIISHNPLWMPMGVVICFGVLLSQIIVLSVIPVMYWQIFKKKNEKDKITDGLVLETPSNNESQK